MGDDVVYITVKESVLHGKRIYSVERIEIEKLAGILEEAREISPTLFPSARASYNINKGHNPQLAQRSVTLDGYEIFIDLVRKYEKIR